MHHSIPPEIHLTTRFLCQAIAECTTETFFEFHKLHSFDVEDIVARGNELSPSELDQIAGFLQAWFVFGLIRHVLHPSGIHLNIDDFVFIDEEEEEEEESVGDEVESLDESDRAEGSSDVGNGRNVKRPLSTSDHITSSHKDGVKLVATDRITQYMLYWIVAECCTHDPERKEQLSQRHKRIFQLVVSTVNKLINWRCRCFPLDIHDPTILDDVILSIILLTESVCDVSSKLFGDQSLELEWELDNATKAYLMDTGWCPGEIAQLRKQTVHATTLYNISSFDRRCLNKDHTHCSADRCVADQIDESLYETRHAFEGCDCSHIGDNSGDNSGTLEAIASQLDHNAIPVIHVAYGGPTGKDMFISVEESTRAPFVAISHVWSDGLGNTKGNTLPRCQMNRLQVWINALYPRSAHPVSFWIDTICVPRSQSLRRKAIWLMAETYRSADKVLVLDDWLIKTGLPGEVSLDLLKIKACSWSRRLWTLHESILTRKGQLYFQLDQGYVSEQVVRALERGSAGAELTYMANFVGSEDDTLHERYPALTDILRRITDGWTNLHAHVNEIWATLTSVTTPPFRDFAWGNDWNTLQAVTGWYTSHFVWAEARDAFVSMRHVPGNPDSPVLEANAMLVIGYSMRFRSTSWIEDEPICLATLLGQDPLTLLEQSTIEGRMKVLVSRMKHAPIYVLFSPLPRIDSNGFRWAPISFREQNLGNARSPGVTLSSWGEVRPEGLLVTLPSLRLCDKIEESLPPAFHLDVDNQRILAKVTRNIKARVVSPRVEGDEMAIVLRTDLWPLQFSRNDAVLVSVCKIVEGVKFSQLMAILELTLPEADDRTPWRSICAVIEPRKVWCVG